MAASTKIGGLSVRREGQHTRVSSERINVLFIESEPDFIIGAYSKFVDSARGHFRPLWASYRGANIDEADLDELTQRAALDSLYFFVVNKVPLQIFDREWQSAQTRRIVRACVERRFREGSAEATDLCAHLMGFSPEEYLCWREGDDRYRHR